MPASHKPRKNVPGPRSREMKRQWKAVVSAVADKERIGTALSFKWSLSAEEQKEIKDGPQVTRWRPTRSLQRQLPGGNTVSHGGFLLLILLVGQFCTLSATIARAS
ncbi:hypothetical protein ANCDUO_25533 [Ancylostoma duodenale]|uniref:Uncharacterized protein n=1 Tax=Ancylostoma duodenale TaxID=51022 RepID=A0A0C2FHP6_9BILA|nr:hypothetical protein ANCDUO_25533 [Ancylostoma duodenale]